MAIDTPVELRRSTNEVGCAVCGRCTIDDPLPLEQRNLFLLAFPQPREWDGDLVIPLCVYCLESITREIGEQCKEGGVLWEWAKGDG